LLGHERTLAYETWPAFDASLTKEDTIEIPVQIKGKVRAKITVPADVGRDDLEAAAKADAKVIQLIGDQEIVKVIVVPGRLVNFVVR
jgi:leucyl-tRNA synthetase